MSRAEDNKPRRIKKECSMEQQRETRSARFLERTGHSWGWPLAFGLITLIVGILALTYPGVTLGVVAIVFGLQLLLVGLFRLVLAFTGGEHHRALGALSGLLAIVAGIICLRHVAQTVVILTLVIGIYWVAYGILLTITGISQPSLAGGGWAVFTGVLAFIAGVFLLTFPISSALGIAIVLGVWLIVLGILSILAAFALRAGDHDVTPGDAKTDRTLG
jgi:uncharacterized membrane protein HdeD (DUF308 family)